MTNRIGPVDPSMIGKVGGSVDESSRGTKVSADKGSDHEFKGRTDAATDTVNLTSAAKLLERLEKSLQTLPAVDGQRVADVKLAIENGNYEIDSKAVADAIIRFERSLGE